MTKCSNNSFLLFEERDSMISLTYVKSLILFKGSIVMYKNNHIGD